MKGYFNFSQSVPIWLSCPAYLILPLLSQHCKRNSTPLFATLLFASNEFCAIAPKTNVVAKAQLGSSSLDRPICAVSFHHQPPSFLCLDTSHLYAFFNLSSSEKPIFANGSRRIAVWQSAAFFGLKLSKPPEFN